MANNLDKADTVQMRQAAARVLNSSPGLAEKIAKQDDLKNNPPLTAYGSIANPNTGGTIEKDAMIMDLQRQLDTEKDKNRQLEDQFKYRVGSFIKRETQAKKTIESLEKQLMERTDDEHRQRMGVIRNMHDSVCNGLEEIQNRTAKVLQEQEKDLMRAFRARLQDVYKELETQRTAKGDHSAELQARHRRVVQELHASQELAQIFDKKNLSLQNDNQKLQDQLRTREDDRQALLKELVLARREVNKLKSQISDNPIEKNKDLKKEKGSPPKASSKVIDQNRLQCSRNAKYERELRYREAITKLKKMYEVAKKEVQQLTTQMAQSGTQRTELEILLQAALDDVKMEIARKEDEEKRVKKADSLTGTMSLPRIPVDTKDTKKKDVTVYDLAGDDRDRVLGLLLSQKRVVELLYTKTFPKKPPSPPPEPTPEDFTWLDQLLQTSP